MPSAFGGVNKPVYRGAAVLPVQVAGRAMYLRPAGQVSFAPQDATYYTYARDVSGNSVDLDATGHPISGTVTDATGAVQADGWWGGNPTLVGGQAVTFYRGGNATLASTASGIGSQFQRWAMTDTGKYTIGGVLVLTAAGVLVLAMMPPKGARGRKAARRNPSRRRRHRRGR